MIISSIKARKWFWISEACAWLGFILLAALLYEKWYTPGPHGPFPWVGMDFVPYWVGVRSMLVGESPYASETTRLIQYTLMGGGVPGGQLRLPRLPRVRRGRRERRHSGRDTRRVRESLAR